MSSSADEDSQKLLAVMLRFAIARWIANSPREFRQDLRGRDAQVAGAARQYGFHADEAKHRLEIEERFLILSRFLLTAGVAFRLNDSEIAGILENIVLPSPPSIERFEVELDVPFVYRLICEGLVKGSINTAAIPEHGDAGSYGQLLLRQAAAFEGQPRLILEQPFDDINPNFRSGADELDNKSVEFWKRWFVGHLDGTPIPWELQRRVALISDEDWEKGAPHIAGLIKKFELEKTEGTAEAEEDTLVSPAAAQAMTKRIAANREAIALMVFGVLEQITEYREKIRGDNQLDTDLRTDLLEYLDNLSQSLRDLLGLFPEEPEDVNDETGENGVLWLRAFKTALFANAHQYTNPENVAGAAIPTGIILMCTGIGSLLGMPVAGTAVGGLLTGQLKPGKAVDDLLKPGNSSAEF